MKRQMDLTEDNILKGFCLFAVPLLLGSLFQQLYGTVDLLFVGNFLGKQDAAAVGASSILVTCLIGLFIGISVGAGVVTAQNFGAGKYERIRKGAVSCSVFSACVTAAISACVLLLLYVFVGRFHTISSVAAVYPITWGLAAASIVGCYVWLERRGFGEKQS